MTALQKCAINDLNATLTPVYVEGLLIAKTDVRVFTSKQDKSKRGVINFTVRDSKKNFINCGVWGTDKFIDTYNLTFHIGDIVMINKPRIDPKKHATEYYQPLTTSPFELIVNEGNAFICRESGERNLALEALRSETIKPTTNALNLEDICGTPNISKHLVDLLVMVRLVKPTRNLHTQFGDKVLREVFVMDESNGGVMLTIWGGDYVHRAQDWKPMETILHLVDVVADYSNFSKCVTLTLAKRSIIIEDPVSSARSHSLKNYVLNGSLPRLLDISGGSDIQVDLSTITNVMSIHKIRDLCDAVDGEEQFTALVYAVITKFEIDLNNAYSKYCTKCNRLLKPQLISCEDPNCIMQLAGTTDPIISEKFNVLVNLSDHTGSLVNCRLMDSYAANVLGHNITEYKNLSENEIEIIRSKYMLERYAVKILVKRKTAFRTRVYYNVLDFCPVDGETAKSQLKVY